MGGMGGDDGIQDWARVLLQGKASCWQPSASQVIRAGPSRVPASSLRPYPSPSEIRVIAVRLAQKAATPGSEGRDAVMGAGSS